MKTVLGTWRVGSGNDCTFVLSVDRARAVHMKAVWRDAPTPDDHEEFHLRVLPEAWASATTQIEGRAAIIKARRELTAMGLVERKGIRDGQWVWGLTDKAAPLAGDRDPGAAPQETLQ